MTSGKPPAGADKPPATSSKPPATSDKPAAGLPRRRQRLSDQETEQRMLAAALGMVHRAGLTVSLDHISFEDVIREAGVSRSAVYRRWPYKDLFFSDLLKELAKGSSPAIAGTNPRAVTAVNRILLERLDWLTDPGRRMALAGEALRQSALAEFETFHESPEWRTYFALHATFLSLPDGDLRDDVQTALTTAERALITGLATSYERVTQLLGLRLRPQHGAGFTTIAGLASALIRGLVLMAPTNPAVATERFDANPFGAPEQASWSPPALGMASVVLSHLEPDPEVEFDEQRLATVREAIERGDWAKG
ncbi:TetR/AcrR family transcriptional regulator [Saccharopolyspora taberi]|uniref:HTH tetR-type domain-containing protein n=1 Tax=Saccharopolyspora taberi TaxID=60895 RepID=A0ABN3VEF2_9PSEU